MDDLVPAAPPFRLPWPLLVNWQLASVQVPGWYTRRTTQDRNQDRSAGHCLHRVPQRQRQGEIRQIALNLLPMSSSQDTPGFSRGSFNFNLAGRS